VVDQPTAVQFLCFHGGVPFKSRGACERTRLPFRALNVRQNPLIVCRRCWRRGVSRGAAGRRWSAPS